jgi:hypothetical protein
MVRGQSAATGYWSRYDASRQTFQGEWLRTGDTYVHDADGYYQCLGRTGDMLKASGIWVSPTEVEARLLAHDSVAQAVVVAAPDSDGLEKPVAFVVLATGKAANRGRVDRVLPSRTAVGQTTPANSVHGRLSDDGHRQDPSGRVTADGRRSPDRPTTDSRSNDLMSSSTNGPIDKDLVVIGGGPVGLYAAYYAGFVVFPPRLSTRCRSLEAR